MRSKQPVEKESKFRELSENRGHTESTTILYALALQKYSVCISSISFLKYKLNFSTLYV